MCCQKFTLISYTSEYLASPHSSHQHLVWLFIATLLDSMRVYIWMSALHYHTTSSVFKWSNLKQKKNRPFDLFYDCTLLSNEKPFCGKFLHYLRNARVQAVKYQSSALLNPKCFWLYKIPCRLILRGGSFFFLCLQLKFTTLLRVLWQATRCRWRRAEVFHLLLHSQKPQRVSEQMQNTSRKNVMSIMFPVRWKLQFPLDFPSLHICTYECIYFKKMMTMEK